jgi:hypothetical protein
MLRMHIIRHGMMTLGVLGLLMAAAPSQAEPSALDEKGAQGKDDQPAKEQPKEKKAITVPAGTAMMVKTGEEVSSNDKPGRRFSATLQANLLAGDVVVAESGSQVYGRVVSSGEIGRGIVAQHSDLVLNLTDINIEGTMYPITTGSFSEKSTSVILRKRSVVVPAGSLLEFRLTQPLTVKK